MNRQDRIAAIQKDWETNPRWKGLTREHTAEDVVRLQGSFTVEHTLARRGAERLWELLGTEDYVHALGAMTGGQAVQMVKAGLKAIYLSGWQVAGDANSAGQVYPDQSLYPVNSGPSSCGASTTPSCVPTRSSGARATTTIDCMLPIVADAEAGFGGALNVYELTKAYIAAGAAAVHLEDQLASEKKCGHMGGKVLVPTSQHVRTLKAARLAADVSGVPTLVVARTDSLAATLLTSDIDDRDHAVHHRRALRRGLLLRPQRHGHRHRPRPRLRPVRRPHLVRDRRSRTSTKRRGSPRRSTPSSPASCWPTTARRRSTGRSTSTTPPSPRSRRSSGPWATGSSSSPLRASMRSTSRCSSWPRATPTEGMTAYVRLQEAEFGMEDEGYSATRHQREVGAGYFDDVATIVSGGTASTLALEGSTEQEQF